MKLNEEKKWTHVNNIIGFSFIGSVATFLISFFFPPDMSTDPPTFSPVMMALGQMGTSLIILGCVALGLKLAEEKKTLPAIGFTMMSIAQGVMFVLYLTSDLTNEKLEEMYKTFLASMFLLVPAMLMIAVYSEFPRWLRITGVIACLPYITENVVYAITRTFNTDLMMIDGIGNLLFNITMLCWGILILKNGRRELEVLKSEGQ